MFFANNARIGQNFATPTVPEAKTDDFLQPWIEGFLCRLDGIIQYSAPEGCDVWQVR